MKRLLPAIALAMALSACGGSSGDDASLDGRAASPAAGALASKPAVEIPDGPAPTVLVINDLVEGTGAEAVSGKEITVKYVGVTYPDGNEFDASWGGPDFTFVLGSGSVIAGWDQGFSGMKEGGRRQLVIPPDLAYGSMGQGQIPPNATLVFVVDLVKVG